MLPQHQPLVVAEQFRMLESLFPGRIDLGVGASLGFTGAVRAALRREQVSADENDAELRELLAYLHDERPIIARPRTGPIPVHVLASRSGIARAARHGLPVVIGGPMVFDERLPAMLADYRAAFNGDRPHVSLAMDVFVADTEAQARELALPEAWSMAMVRRTGAFRSLESAQRILADPWPQSVRDRVERHLEQVVLGTAGTVAARVQQLADAARADEILVSSCTYDADALAALDAAVLRTLSGISTR